MGSPEGNSVAAGNLIYRIGVGPTRPGPRKYVARARSPHPSGGTSKPKVSTTHEPVATQEEPGKTTAAKKHLAITPAAVWNIRFARQPTPYHQASPPRPTLPPAGDPPRRTRTECEQPAANPLGGPPITRSDKNPTKKFSPLGHIYAKNPRA